MSLRQAAVEISIEGKRPAISQFWTPVERLRAVAALLRERELGKELDACALTQLVYAPAAELEACRSRFVPLIEENEREMDAHAEHES